jgi:hypothetical protein
MTVDDFINLFNGHFCDWDGAYGNQCADLVQFYSKAIGGPVFTGNAVAFYSQPGSFFTQVPNTPTGVPIKGDIVVWNGSYNGGPGHVGISTGKGDTNTFEVLEQNDPTGSNCHLRTYNYNYITGWLHPKTLPTNPVDNSAKYVQALQTIVSTAHQVGV